MGRLTDHGLRPRFASAILGITVALWLARAEAAYDPADEGWEGCSELLELARAQLGSERVRSIDHLDYSVLEPADGVIFVYPEVEIRFHPLAAFLAAGGRAAVVDDYGSAESLLERFHIHRANAPASPELRVLDNSQLPVAIPAPSESSPAEPSDHPTLRGVSQVVTNHPTALRLESGIELTNLLLIPARGEPDALLAVTGVIGDARACGLGGRSNIDVPAGRCGRLLAMADPSALINLMLRYPGNREFARGLVSYLLEDDAWGARGGNLYILHGRFRQTGSFGGAPGLEESVQEQQAALLAWLAEVKRNGLPEPISIGLAALLGLGVAVWAGLASGQPYVPAVPAYAQSTPLINQGGFAGRFAVLASPAGDRGLILLELKRTLEAKLSSGLGLSPGSSARAILEALNGSLRLSPRSVQSLSETFRRLSAAEAAVLQARRLSISDRELAELHQRVLDILAEMKHDEGDSDRGAQH
jgi:hypothetical protein